MATLSSTPARELSDSELRKRLLTLGYDVPVSVNREFLVRKLESASATAVGGGGGKVKSSRHSMAATPSSQPATPGTARKRKSLAVSPGMNSMSPPGTPQQYVGTPNSNISMATPSTPSPFVSRLGTPSPGSSPNGDASHSPRYMNYYNMFKTTPGGGGSGDSDGASYGYGYSRSSRLSAPPGSFNPVTSVAPPGRSERNGYSTAGGQTGGQSGVDSDWWSGQTVSKILLGLFILFFLVIGGAYVSKNMAVDPRGLTSEGGGSSSQVPPKPTPPAPPKKKELPLVTSMVYPVCGLKGIDPNACIPKDVVKNSRSLFNALKDELTQRARMVGCHSDVQESVSLQDAKTMLYKLTDLRKSDVDLAFEGMLLLVTENPRAGLTLIGPDGREDAISSREVSSLDVSLTKISATGIHPDFICGVKSMIFSFALHVIILLGVVAFGGVGWKGFKFYRTRKEREQDEIFKMVETILERLYQQKELSENSKESAYLAINHVRDELVPPKERLKKEAFWNKVVDYIANHESRVREEIQHISGEEFKVWRWIDSASPIGSAKRYSMANSQGKMRYSIPGSPVMTSSPLITPRSPGGGPTHLSMSPPIAMQQQHPSLYPSLSGLSSVNDDEDEGIDGGAGDTNSNNKWQGQAFETCEGSPNALPSTPTTCLKIRHMVAEKDGAKERSRIERHILEKCGKAKILHIGIDQSSVEGCVYIRCSTKDDARVAFMALHGWWFEGKLLSVKFLREERYFNRFPEARNNSVPLTLR